MKQKDKKIIIILICILIIIDQISKIFILIQLDQVVDISFKNIVNSNNITYILISIIATSALIRYISMNNKFITKITRIIISVAIAGIISNMFDRLWIAKVITISLKNNININLAYIYILIAWIGMAVIFTKYTNQRIKNRESKKINKKENK